MDAFQMSDDGSQGRGEERRNRVHIKLCARGHWRPHEDAKLKELVAHYGPQNWNLIAENLPGRSGNISFHMLNSYQTYSVYLMENYLCIRND